MKNRLFSLILSLLMVMLIASAAVGEEIITTYTEAIHYGEAICAEPLISLPTEGAQWDGALLPGEPLYRLVMKNQSDEAVLTFPPTGAFFGLRDLRRYPLDEGYPDVDIGFPGEYGEVALPEDRQAEAANLLKALLDAYAPQYARAANVWYCLGCEERTGDGETMHFAHFIFYESESARSEGEDAACYAVVQTDGDFHLVFCNPNYGAEGSNG